MYIYEYEYMLKKLVNSLRYIRSLRVVTISYIFNPQFLLTYKTELPKSRCCTYS